MVIRKLRTTIHALIGTIVVIGGSTVVTPSAQAITIPVACSENALADAVNLANSTTATDTLVLASGCTYGPISPHDGLANGLPVITTRIEMIGPAAITHSSLLLFRIAEALPVIGNTGSQGGGIAAVSSAATTMPQTAAPVCGPTERTECGAMGTTASSCPPSTTIHKGLIVA